MQEQDMVLNNQQWLICSETKQNLVRKMCFHNSSRKLLFFFFFFDKIISRFKLELLKALLSRLCQHPTT